MVAQANTEDDGYCKCWVCDQATRCMSEACQMHARCMPEACQMHVRCISEEYQKHVRCMLGVRSGDASCAYACYVTTHRGHMTIYGYTPWSHDHIWVHPMCYGHNHRGMHAGHDSIHYGGHDSLMGICPYMGIMYDRMTIYGYNI